MRVIGIIVCILSVCYELKAQTLMGSGGAYHIDSGMQLQWSLGESFIGTNNNSSNHLLIGFQQPISTQIVGLNDIEKLEGIGLYPNPLLNHLYVKLPAGIKDDYELKISNMHGQNIEILLELEADQLKIDASKWPSGVYLLQLSHAKQVFFAKLLKL